MIDPRLIVCGYVYQVYCDGQPVPYVGSTTNLNKRRRDHIKTGKFSSYGSNLDLRVLETVMCPDYYDELGRTFKLRDQEDFHIKVNRTYSHHGGLNKMHPVDQLMSGRIHSEMGRLGGKKHIESGHISRLGKVQGKIQGRKNVESGQIASISSIGGKVSGRKNIESGHLASIRNLPQTKAAQSKVGKIYGRQNVESGFLESICTFESRSKGGRRNIESGHIKTLNHKKWHVNRHVIDPKCEFCLAVAEQTNG